jgi:hypothetical protein
MYVLAALHHSRPARCAPTRASFLFTSTSCAQSHFQDWQKKHELDRKAIKELVCALCATRQPVAASCIACGVDFGALPGLRGSCQAVCPCNRQAVVQS